MAKRRITGLKAVAVFVCAVMGFSFAACGEKPSQSGGGTQGEEPPSTQYSTLLGAPKAVESLNYSELVSDGYTAFLDGVEAFAADFAGYSYADYKKQDNFAVSPISVYMVLALSSECAAGDTRAEILNALGVTRQELQTHFSTLYRALTVERKVQGKTTSMLSLSNSIWINEGTGVKQPCIDALSNDYFTYSYSTDFKYNNEGANKAIRDFVKEKTKGLIDQDFQLSEDTLFTLINTLYLKTIWDDAGDDLPFAEGNYKFTQKDGSVKNAKLLQGYYAEGRPQAFEKFTTFYARTYDGYKIKFILPNEGHTLEEVFTAENLSEVNAIKNYGGYDEAADVRYLTRVLFPEYKCKYDENIIGILQDKFNIDLFFKNPDLYSPACDFSTLSDEPCFCSKVQHVTDLTVNKKGIEGAAVTVIGMEATAVEPKVTVEEDFIVDKAFGFILTDSRNVTLFSGVVNQI